MILVTKIPQEGQPFKIAISKTNLVEVSPKGNESWCKYWDGREIRTMVIQESPEEVVGMYD